MEQYIAPLWLILFIFLALIVLFILSKLQIIRNKLNIIAEYTQKIDELYKDDGDNVEEME